MILQSCVFGRLLIVQLVWMGLALTGCRSAQPAADLILYNGTIWTVDDDRPTAEAVAIRGDRFAYVGSTEQALAHRGRHTEVIDLHGRFVCPGFIDSHVHAASAARFLEFNVMTTATQEAFVDRVRDVLARVPPGEWIVGGYWGAYDQWAAGSAGGAARRPFTPDMRRVDAITRNHRMFIRKFDNSEFAVNTAALKAMGLDPANPQADEVEFVRGKDGQFTGIIRGDGVLNLYREHVPTDFSHARRVQQTKHTLQVAVSRGVTGISDMSDDEQLAIYRELRARDELPLRIHFRYHLERWKELADRGVRIGTGDEWIRLGCLKGHIDGIMGTSTARFFEPYTHDPTNRGRWRRLMVDDEGNFVEGKFLRYMLGADAAGLQLSVHAIGDEANHLLLNYLQELSRQNGVKDRRFRLVHAQVLAPDDIPRLGALDVIAEVQPYHLSDDMRWMEERIGYERCKGAYAFKDIKESGGMLSFGSDWPGTSASSYPIDPMLGLYAAVTRKTTTGQPPDGWFPEQRITMAEAIRAYTYNNAYTGFEEDIKGSIEAGKLSDLVVLSQNLLEIEPSRILETEVLYTVVGGRIVYQRP